MSMRDASFRQFDGEWYFVRKLRDYGIVHINFGITDEHVRRERIRRAIIDAGLAEQLMFKTREGQKETYREAFERFYCCPLLQEEATITQGEQE